MAADIGRGSDRRSLSSVADVRQAFRAQLHRRDGYVVPPGFTKGNFSDLMEQLKSRGGVRRDPATCAKVRGVQADEDACLRRDLGQIRRGKLATFKGSGMPLVVTSEVPAQCSLATKKPHSSEGST